MNRFAPPLMLVLVTALLYGYGRHPWSWLGGPLAAIAVWALERTAHEASAPAPAHARGPEPAPVD